MLEIVDKMMEINDNKDKLDRYLTKLEHDLKQ